MQEKIDKKLLNIFPTKIQKKGGIPFFSLIYTNIMNIFAQKNISELLYLSRWYYLRNKEEYFCGKRSF